MRIWILLFFAIWLSACSDEKVSGISSVETQNALLIQVVDADSKPVSGAVARVRSAYWAYAVQSYSTFAELETDSSGYVVLDSNLFNRIDSLNQPKMAIEILDQKQGAYTVIDRRDLAKNATSEMKMTLYRLQTLSGNVEGGASARISLYGTTKTAMTDSQGHFEMSDVAPGDYLFIVETDSLIATGDVYVQEFAGSCETTECSETVLNISFEDTTLEVSKQVIRTKDTADYGYMRVIDFEDGLASGMEYPFSKNYGYLGTTDTNVVTTPSKENAAYGIERGGYDGYGYSFHWKSSAPSGRWSFFGLWICSEETPCDLNALDSVEFYIRGSGRYSFSFESLGESNYQGKALYYDTLKVDSASDRNDAEIWKRVSITPAGFVKGDSSWGNLGWEMIHDKVTNISVAAYGEAEIWLDDIKFYGIKQSDLK